MSHLPPPVSWVFETSLRVSLAIALLMLLRPWVRRRFGNFVLPWMWLIVAARLLLPWPVASRWSIPLFGWASPVSASSATMAGSPVVRSSVEAAPDDVDAFSPDPATPVPSAIVGGRAPFARGREVWNGLWLAGMVAGMLNLAVGWRQTRRWASQTSPGEEDARLMRVFASIPAGQRRGVALRISDALDIPTLVGVTRPQIWIPRIWLSRLDTRELRYILLHELGHAGRFDLLAQWFCSFACCVHWFNPIVWMAARLARADRELACDAHVLARGSDAHGDDFPIQYGRTLIKIVEHLCEQRPRRNPTAAVAMATGGRSLSLRIREIGSFRQASAWRALVAGVVSAVVVMGFTISDAAPGPDKPDPVPSASPAPPVTAPAAPPAPVPATSPAASPAVPAQQITGTNRSARRQFECAAKIIAISKSQVQQLMDQQTASSGSVGLIDQLNAIFDQNQRESDRSSGTFSVNQVISAGEQERFLQRFAKLKSADLISAPRVTTKSGQRAVIEIIEEFLYPTKFTRTSFSGVEPVLTPTKFEKKNVGLTLDVEGAITPAQDAIDLIVNWQFAEVQGWVDKGGKPVSYSKALGAAARPVFSTQTIETCVTVPAGSTLVLASPPRAPGTFRAFRTLGGGDEGGTRFKEDFIILNLITLTLIDVPQSAAERKAALTPDQQEALADINRKLQSIVIPAVDFQVLALTDAVEFLRQESRRLDPDPDPEKRGVNIFLKLPKQASAVNSDASSAPAAPPGAKSGSGITLKMRQESLLDVLRAVAAQANLKEKVEPYAVSLVPLSEQTETLITATFIVKPEVIGAPAVTNNGDGSAAPRFDPRPWLIARGVTFPAGSSGTYLPKVNKLVIRNTRDNVARIEALDLSSAPVEE